jgi:GNAT superfamily N-acetyltransferase
MDRMELQTPRIQQERVAGLWSEIKPICAANHDETGMLPGVPLDLATEQYEQLEDMGLLRCYTARTEWGRLIGYSVFIVSTSLHSRRCLQACQDALFILPEYRLGSTGLRLIRFADEALANEGVEVVVRQTTANRDISRIFEGMGYLETHRCYARRLDRRIDDGH